MASKRSSSEEERSSSQTNGAMILAISSMGRAMIIAIVSAARKASCLGTSSPMTRLK